MNAPVCSPVVGVCDDMVFDLLIETFDLAESYARSARESAWRGDRQLLACHLRQLRACVVTALDAQKQLSTTRRANDAAA